jgi:parallel beta-helix repeat protein
VLKGRASILFASLLVFGLFIFAFPVQPVRAQPGTIYIRADGSISPSTAPISSPDNITYTLYGNVTDSIVVQRNNIILDGAGYSVQGARIPGSFGIVLSGRSNVTVKNTKVVAFFDGVSLESSSRCSVLRDFILNNTQIGVSFSSSKNCNLLENTFANDGFGVDESFGNNVADNLVNGKPLVYFEKESDYVVGDAGEVVLVDCNNMTINNLDLSHTSNGVELYQTNDTRITNNNLTNDYDGVYLYLSHNCSVSGNKIIANAWYGVYVGISSNCTISGNTLRYDGVALDSSYDCSIFGNNITNCSCGIYLVGCSSSVFSGNNLASNDYGIEVFFSSGNLLFHNNFNNTKLLPVYSFSSTNTWDNGYPSGGNYWSDYLTKYPNATEIDGSGIGSIPYVIDANNTDHYPLLNLASVPEFQPFMLPHLFTIITLLGAIVIKRRALRIRRR